MTAHHVTTEDAAGRAPVIVPEDDVVFRLAQLTLLLASLRRHSQSGISLERLGCYDFLVANPLLVLTDENDPNRKRLLMAGFDGRALSYASPAHRFTTRRERLQHDLALLVGYGLVEPTVDKSLLYVVTPAGEDLAGKFTAVYARSYRLSADLLIRKLAGMSNKRLYRAARAWTTVETDGPRPEALNLLDAVDLSPDHEVMDPESGSAAGSKSPRRPM